MDSIKSIADNIADKSTRLTMLFLDLMSVEKNSSTAYAVNDDVVACAFALDKLMTEGEYDYGPVLEYFLDKSKRKASFIDVMKTQIEYYLKAFDNREDIAKELSERIIFIQFHKKNAAWGDACPMVQLDLNMFSPNFKVQYMLTTKGPESVLRFLDFEPHVYNLPKAKAETSVTEKNNEIVDYGDLPMKFHKFWVNVALPLSILGYCMALIASFISISYAGVWSILDITFYGVQLVLSVIATMGLRCMERKAFVAHKWLLITAFIYAALYSIIFVLVEPTYLIGFFGGTVMNILVYIYYKKREALFLN